MKDVKKYRLSLWVKYTLFIIAIVSVILVLNKLLANDMEEHIEKVSKECASQGYGIKARYTKEGDKFYKCNKDGDE